MCGIVGIAKANSKRLEKPLNQMVDALYHRGPDDSGTYHFLNCSLGHARLSIVDLNTGQQPMIGSNSKTGIVFNGEIYGFKEIKNNLLNDFQFRTSSDTEVILALYSKYGSHFLEKLPGAFSFALWDENRQELICARDRFGEKPFYYAFGKNNEFIFASEIKAIVSSGLVEPVLDTNALAYYFKNLYIDPNNTIYKNIFTLPPAHKLSYKNQSLKIEKYWNLPQPNNNIAFDEAVTKFSELFKKSVSRQLIADVPVAAFLSGGLDSTSIVAMAREVNPQINVFSFKFGDTINEVPIAKKTAKKYNLQLTELDASNYDLVSILENMQSVYDEPFADSSNIPTFLLSKEAAKHSKVVLTGDGGDELMGGYSWYFPLEKLSKRLNNNDLLFSLFYFTKIRLSQVFKNKTNLYRQNLYNIKDLRKKGISEFHFHQQHVFNDAEILRLLKKDFQYNKPSGFNLTNTANDAIYMDLVDYMPGDILVKIDRASMANSLELRAPFLDIELAEFCISLPSDFKIDSRISKKILRKSFEHLWLEEVKTTKKQGFGAPG
jgi:asparagine synthase (glutamine-hydrolysing)